MWLESWPDMSRHWRYVNICVLLEHEFLNNRTCSLPFHDYDTCRHRFSVIAQGHVFTDHTIFLFYKIWKSTKFWRNVECSACIHTCLRNGRFSGLAIVKTLVTRSNYLCCFYKSFYQVLLLLLLCSCYYWEISV